MKAVNQILRHILIIPSWYFDEDSEGIFIHEHARMTVEMGYHVGLIYIRRQSFTKSRTTAFYQSDQINVGILKAYYLPKVMWAISHWKRRYLQLFREYTEKYGTPDIIHAHGYVAGMAARHLSVHNSIPYVITEHSTSIPARRVRWFHRYGLRRAYRDAAALVAVSAYLKKAMQSWAEMKDIAVIYNPIDLRKFQVAVAKSSDAKHLIAIGSLEPRKNFNMLLEAVALLRKDFPIRLKLIGTGSELEALQKRASDLGLMSQIEWLLHQPASEVARHLMQSDLLISSSVLETFGVVIVEALACGIPVVVTKSGAPQEYLHQSIGRIVPFNDAKALASEIKYVLDHQNAFNPHEIRAFAGKYFDFPVIGAQIDALYQGILNKVT